jgi:hypothetical protein
MLPPSFAPANTGPAGTAAWELRLTGHQAIRYATRLERTRRWWTTILPLAQGCALIELRSRQRPYPIVAALRTERDCLAYLSIASRAAGRQPKQAKGDGHGQAA